MDLVSIQDTDSVEFELKDPRDNKTPLGAFITLAGPEHPKRRTMVFAAQRRARVRMQKIGRLDFADPEEDEQAGIDMAVACTLGWRGIEEGGKPVQFSEAAARDIYTRKGFTWIRRQVQDALGDQALFITDSVKS
jgi:hypothetical protein